MTSKYVWPLCGLLLGGGGLARGDVVSPRFDTRPAPHPRPTPQPSAGSRDAVSLARRDPEILKLLVLARKGESDQTGPSSANETAVQISLGGQCGFAGCSSATLVAFTFRSPGANTTTHSVLALVSCPSIPSQPCTVAPAEVRASGGSSTR